MTEFREEIPTALHLDNVDLFLGFLSRDVCRHLVDIKKVVFMVEVNDHSSCLQWILVSAGLNYLKIVIAIYYVHKSNRRITDRNSFCGTQDVKPPSSETSLCPMNQSQKRLFRAKCALISEFKPRLMKKEKWNWFITVIRLFGTWDLFHLFNLLIVPTGFILPFNWQRKSNLHGIIPSPDRGKLNV